MYKKYPKEPFTEAIEKIYMYLERMSDGKSIQKAVISLLSIDLEHIALYNFFTKNNLEVAKQYFYLYGRTVEIDICTYNNAAYLSYAMFGTTNLLLSDNSDLIYRYADLKDQNYDAERKENGGLICCIQAIIRNDWNFLKEQIAINEDKILSKKRGKWIESDHLFFRGMMEQDQQKIEEAIHLLLTTKQHRSRNIELSWTKECLSIPALTYTKLAWFKGIEVEIDNPLVPKELLPITPNKEYWEYDFMKWDKFKCDT